MSIDPDLLRRVCDGLKARFGDRIDRLVLYGSRARGDARADSDYDLALFLKDYRTFGQEVAEIVALTDPILFETDQEFSVLPFPAEHYHRRTMLMHEIRKDGIDLMKSELIS